MACAIMHFWPGGTAETDIEVHHLASSSLRSS